MARIVWRPWKYCTAAAVALCGALCAHGHERWPHQAPSLTSPRPSCDGIPLRCLRGSPRNCEEFPRTFLGHPRASPFGCKSSPALPQRGCGSSGVLLAPRGLFLMLPQCIPPTARDRNNSVPTAIPVDGVTVGLVLCIHVDNLHLNRHCN